MPKRIDAIQSALTPEEFRGFCKGTAMRYLFKDDIRTAQVYLARLIDKDPTPHIIKDEWTDAGLLAALEDLQEPFEGARRRAFAARFAELREDSEADANHVSWLNCGAVRLSSKMRNWIAARFRDMLGYDKAPSLPWDHPDSDPIGDIKASLEAANRAIDPTWADGVSDDQMLMLLDSGTHIDSSGQRAIVDRIIDLVNGDDIVPGSPIEQLITSRCWPHDMNAEVAILWRRAMVPIVATWPDTATDQSLLALLDGGCAIQENTQKNIVDRIAKLVSDSGDDVAPDSGLAQFIRVGRFAHSDHEWVANIWRGLMRQTSAIERDMPDAATDEDLLYLLDNDTELSQVAQKDIVGRIAERAGDNVLKDSLLGQLIMTGGFDRSQNADIAITWRRLMRPIVDPRLVRWSDDALLKLLDGDTELSEVAQKDIVGRIAELVRSTARFVASHSPTDKLLISGGFDRSQNAEVATLWRALMPSPAADWRAVRDAQDPIAHFLKLHEAGDEPSMSHRIALAAALEALDLPKGRDREHVELACGRLRSARPIAFDQIATLCRELTPNDPVANFLERYVPGGLLPTQSQRNRLADALEALKPGQHSERIKRACTRLRSGHGIVFGDIAKLCRDLTEF